MRKLVLRNFQSPGDIVMLTAAVRDLHRAYPGEFVTDVRTSCPDLWTHNPYLTPLQENAPGVEVIDCHYPLIHESNHAPWHFLHGFIDFLNRRLGLSIRPTAFRGDINLSEEEMQAPPPYAPYWMIVAGGKKDFTIKWWSPERYQSVVDHFRGRLQFVQVGESGHVHPSLPGVIDLRGKTSLRQLLRLVYWSSGVVSPVSLMMHLAAAVDYPDADPGSRPCVVVAGGREPPHWEAYPTHQFLHTIGMLPCCRSGGCWKSRTRRLGDGEPHDDPGQLCVDVEGDLPRCMWMIRPEHVIDRIEAYLAAPRKPAPAFIKRNGTRAVFQRAWSFGRPRASEANSPVTICVLTYGDYFDLARTTIDSILRNCDPAKYRLLVGANSVAAETRLYLEALRATGKIDRLWLSESNIGKIAMMRWMFAAVDTEFVWWFDHDSHIVEPNAMESRLESARQSPASVAIWGHVFFFSHEHDFNAGTDVVEFVKSAPWYRGKEPGAATEGRWFFATGGCWLARTEALRDIDWPDMRLTKRYDDVILCEALRQHDWEIRDIGPCGVAINTQPQRGPE